MKYELLDNARTYFSDFKRLDVRVDEWDAEFFFSGRDTLKLKYGSPKFLTFHNLGDEWNWFKNRNINARFHCHVLNTFDWTRMTGYFCIITDFIRWERVDLDLVSNVLKWNVNLLLNGIFMICWFEQTLLLDWYPLPMICTIIVGA
jgi:hypothetical protein